MFREHIEKPIDPIPLAYVDKLQRLYNEPDYSLTSLGIALLKSRIENYDGITGVYYSFDNKANAYKDFVNRVNNADTHPLYCYYIYSTDNDVTDVVNESLSEFKQRQNISAFIKEKSDNDCTVLYHETKNIVGIFVNSRDFRLYHLLMSFISLYYPSLFVEKKMTEEDYTIVKSLSNKEKDKFYASIQSVLKPFTAEFRRLQLSSLMKDIHDVKINNALSNVNNLRSRASSAEQQLGSIISQLKEAIMIYEGMKATEQYDAPEEALVEYLSDNKDIHGLDIRDHYLYFSVTTLLNNFNEQAWRSFSDRGNIYDGEYNTTLLDVFKKRENRKILLDAIFNEDPTLFVRMAGNYQINLDQCRVSTSSGYDYENIDPVFKDYMPNPHLKIFECLGGYRDRIMPALRDRNYISAIEICIASAGSINLDEVTQTFRPFLGWLLSSTAKVIQLQDGTAMTPEEALVWLVDNKEKENATDKPVE